MTESKKRANHWNESAFETVSLALATYAGIWEGDLVSNNPVLLFEIESALTIPVIAILYLLAKYDKAKARGFAKYVLKGLTWVTAVIAGNLFAYGYALVLAYRIIGLQGFGWLALYAVIVLWLIRAIKVRESVLEKKIESAKKAKES